MDYLQQVKREHCTEATVPYSRLTFEAACDAARLLALNFGQRYVSIESGNAYCLTVFDREWNEVVLPLLGVEKPVEETKVQSQVPATLTEGDTVLTYTGKKWVINGKHVYIYADRTGKEYRRRP